MARPFCLETSHILVTKSSEKNVFTCLLNRAQDGGMKKHTESGDDEWAIEFFEWQQPRQSPFAVIRQIKDRNCEPKIVKRAGRFFLYWQLDNNDRLFEITRRQALAITAYYWLPVVFADDCKAMMAA